MAGIGRDGLMVSLAYVEGEKPWLLSIERDGSRRVEQWRTKEAALQRAASLMVQWHSEEVGE